MKIENVEVGMKFSNRTKLATKLELPKTSGKRNIELQDKEIARYLSYEKTNKVSRGKVTNEIIITEIYETPKPKVDGRSDGNNNVYAEYIDKLILHTITMYGGEFSLTLANLFANDIKILNKNYDKVRNSTDKYLSKKYDISGFQARQYLYKVREKFTDMFKSSCKRLVRQGLITYHKDYMLVEQGVSDFVVVNNSKIISQIQLIEEEVLLSMGIERKHLLNDENYENWHKECVVRVSKEVKEYDAFNYWNCYTVKSAISEEEMDKFQLEYKEKERLEQELMKVFMAKLHESLEKKQAKGTQEVFGEIREYVYYPYATKKGIQFVLKIDKDVFNIKSDECNDYDTSIYQWSSYEEESKIKQASIIISLPEQDIIDNIPF